jgi:hypothetical protein
MQKMYMQNEIDVLTVAKAVKLLISAGLDVQFHWMIQTMCVCHAQLELLRVTGDVAAGTGSDHDMQLTRWLRPEDGNWQPTASGLANRNGSASFYFVTTAS